MKVALCTTSRHRLQHLSQTLPKNLRDNADFKDSVCVLLDYGDQEGLPDYIQREHKADLDSGRLVYFRNNEPTRFAMAPAKNMAHRCGMIEGADILVNVDSDNFTGEGFAKYVSDKFEMAELDKEAIFLGTRGNHRGIGKLAKVKTQRGCFGRIAVSTQAFRHTGGYDNVFATYSPDDRDFAARVARIGYRWGQIRPGFLSAIQHGAGMRYRDGYTQFDEVELLRERETLTIVNAGEIGTGVVYRNFAPQPVAINAIPSRVFGIGLHKVATTSLAQAFRMFGYDTAHWESAHWAKYVFDEMRTAGRSRTLEMHYALCDLPIPLFYRELDKAYPGSRFILTVRDEDEWIDSIRVHWQTLRASWDNDVASNEIHKALYGTTEFDEAVFRARYRRHNSEVMAYFRGRSSDFIRIDMDREPSMNPLCAFLGQPPMNRDFPRKNQTRGPATGGSETNWSFALNPKRPDLGGNVRGGDPASFTPKLWRALIARFRVRSVLDVGCGEGHAVKWFLENGAYAIGIDGLMANVSRAVTPIVRADLTAQAFLFPADLVWSCEVAEHIDEKYLDNFLRTLENGRVIAMTHALPGQSGHHHVNCQPSSYWIEHICAQGYEAIDPTEWRELAKQENDGAYFSQSGLVFVRKTQ